MIKAINHITINIIDLEQSLKFYGEILALPKLEEVDRGDHYIRYFGLPGGTKLELIQYNYKSDKAEFSPVSIGFIRHFALEVDDIQGWKTIFEKNSIKICEGPQPCEALGVYYMLIEEPNGVELEFVERL